MRILVTGTAGFIGFHLVRYLLNRGDEVVGLDSINDYYDIHLKYDRLEETGVSQEKTGYNQTVRSTRYSNYHFIQLQLEDKENLEKLFAHWSFDVVCNLAAQAGVRYSLTNPDAYINSNIIGFMNVLECCRHNNIKHLVYASSSSVYGLNEKIPFSTSDHTDHPVSLYAASKKSNELMAHVYSHLYNIPSSGLRFFTVYGPWGRPDMALFLFTKAILEDRPIQVFNNGQMVRDFTYVDDIVEGVVRVIDHAPGGKTGWDGQNPDPSASSAPYKIYNIGNNAPVKLLEFIEQIEGQLGRSAKKEWLPIQPGDVSATYAEVNDLVRDLDYKPSTSVEKGIAAFIKWYRSYYRLEEAIEK